MRLSRWVLAAMLLLMANPSHARRVPAWCPGQVRTADIVDGQVTTPKLAAGAATGAALGTDVATYPATTPKFTGNVRVGTGSPAQATTAGSFYVTGPAEFGGNMFWDGLTGPALIWVDSSHQAHLVTLDPSLSFNAGTSTLSVSGLGGGSTGTLNTIPKLTGTGPLTYGDSMITDNGTIVAVTGAATALNGQPAPAPVSTGPGTAASNSLTVSGGPGGNTTDTAGTVGGVGAPVSITAGSGGTAPSGSTNGAGGAVTINGGATGAGAGAAGSVGNLLLQTTNGNVGIGTTSPASPLDVRLAGSSSGVVEALGNVTNGRFGSLGISAGTGTPFQVFGFTGSDLALGANGTESVRILQNGKVGIGTASPSHLLDLAYGNINFTSLSSPSTPSGIASATAGSLSNGNYKYEVTFVTSQGETSPSVATANIAANADGLHGIDLSAIPVNVLGSSVTGRNIYRTQVGGSSYTRITTGTTLANNTTTILTDTASDASIASNAAAPAQNQATGWILNDGTRVANFLGGGANTSIYLGNGAGVSNTSGTRNTFIGSQAGALNTSGLANTFIGKSAGTNSTVGVSNVFIGDSSGLANTTGSTNVFVGKSSGLVNTTGSNNVFVGQQAGLSNTTALNNTAIGNNSLSNNLTGASISAMGSAAGASGIVGSSNLFIGTSADVVFTPASTMTGTTVANAGSGLTAGVYKYRVTFVCGSETGPQVSPFQITTVAAGSLLEVDLTGIPTYVGPLVCTARKIYRTTVGGAVYNLLTTIPDNSTSIYNDTVADAALTTAMGGPSSSIALGTNAGFMFSSQAVIGGTGNPISNAFFGNGIYNATPASITIQGTGGQGTDIAGANVTISGGKGTGAGAGGALIFQTAPAGSTGTVGNIPVERMRIKGGAATGPAASATESLVRIGSTDIAGGSSSGTFFGLNAPSGYAGDLENWQVNGVSQSKTDASGNLTLTGKATTAGSVNTGGVKVHRTAVASGAYSILATDYYIALTGTTGGTFTLPAAATVGAGAVFIIKDAGRGAATSNLTLARSGSDTLDGATSIVMATNGESVMLISDGVSNYEIN